MKNEKKKRLERAGFKTGTVAEFLGLSREEPALVEIRLAMSEAIRKWRTARNLTQAALATRVGSSQSRIAKIEAADTSVSLDLMIRTLVQMGATPKDVSRAIAR